MTRIRHRAPGHTQHGRVHDTPPPTERPVQPSGARYHIIEQHLRQALHSNTQAQKLQAQGLHADAKAQNRLTQVFIHNALSRVKPQGRNA